MSAVRPHRAKALAAAAAMAFLAPLAACSGDPAQEPTEAVQDDTNGTLAAAISGADNLSDLAAALSTSGLADVFDGPGSYTILAPTNAAFAKLGGQEKNLDDEAKRAEMVALLRGHILPGHLTVDAIRKAIADKKGPVKMTTLGEGAVTFSENGEAIVVTGEDGSTATIEGAPILASNGVVLPIGGLVKKAPIEAAQPAD